MSARGTRQKSLGTATTSTANGGIRDLPATSLPRPNLTRSRPRSRRLIAMQQCDALNAESWYPAGLLPLRWGDKMKRREFIFACWLVGGAAFAWPSAVIAQASVRRAVVAVLFAGSSASATHTYSSFSLGLQELGYVEGRNIDLIYRYGDGDQERLPLLADELVRLKPDVIVTGSPEAVLAVKQATATIPIVC